MSATLLLLCLSLLLPLQCIPVVRVSLPKDSAAVTGRLRVYIQAHNSSMPMNGNSDDQDTNQVFGLDVVKWRGSDSKVVTADILGYPLASLKDLPDGTWFVQAEVLIYDSYQRKNLPEVFMPRSCVSSEGQNGGYAKPDGTLFSSVVTLTQKNGDGSVNLELTRTQPTAKSPGCAGLGDGVDSQYIKTARFVSPRLSEFWNQDITLEACVLLPFGHDEAAHAQAHYPIVIAHGHYSPEWNMPGFREIEPDCDQSTGDYTCIQEYYNWYLYRNWTSTATGVPFSDTRMILVTLNHPVPLFDDSYGVNSEMLGPYGDAIVYEFLPELEKRYRGLGAWARGLMGGSTGGWISAAQMVLYPDEFGYSHAACPDPITFSKYTSVDIYNQDNAYFYNSGFKRTSTPGYRDGYSGTTYPGTVTPYGTILATVEEMNHRELVLGTKGRSCGQWDIWEAVFGPVCPDGYQCRLYDKHTGVLNKHVAEYWKQHFDLGAIAARDWATLGPKLRGKLHIAVGAADTFYLTNAVIDFQRLVEDAATTAGQKDSGIEFIYGAHDGLGYHHCFRGYEYDPEGQPLPNSITRLTYAVGVLPLMAKSFITNAPAGADVTSWRY